MKRLNDVSLIELNGGTKVCDVITGAGIGALITGNAVVAALATVGGIGCWAGWW